MNTRIIVACHALLLLLGCNGKQDEQDAVWVHSLATEAYLGARSVQQATDGSYIVTGDTGCWVTARIDGKSVRDRAGGSLLLHKVSSRGKTLWTREFLEGGAWARAEGHSVRQTADGGYIVVGQGWASHGSGPPDKDVWIIRTNPLGQQVWDKRYGDNWNDEGNCIRETRGGGYIIVGARGTPPDRNNYRHHDIWLLRIGESGDIIWSRTFGEPTPDEVGYSTEQTADGGYIIGGTVDSDLLVIKTDQEGKQTWRRTFPGTTNLLWGGSFITQTRDGGYILAGGPRENRGALVFVKLDENGNDLWSSSFSGQGRSVAYGAAETRDGGYIVCGEIGSFNRPHLLLLKTDGQGKELWSRTYGDSLLASRAYSVQQTTDGGFVLAGATQSVIKEQLGRTSILIVKTDQYGNTEWKDGH